MPATNTTTLNSETASESDDSAKPNGKVKPDPAVNPPVPWILNGFHRFLRPYLRKHFLAIAVERETWQGLEECVGHSVIVYANHPSWWDPLMAHYLHREFFPKDDFFAPIDAAALDHYRVLGKLGFYGVELESHSGAAAFLKTSAAILDRQKSVIWMTPEGRFADPRDHSAELMPGLAHLCHRYKKATALPLALEYVFWDERQPVCLVSLGKPLKSSENLQWTKSDWAQNLEEHLRSAQDRLAQLAIARSSAPFDDFLCGRGGTGVIYDSFRRMKSFVTRKPFKARHGDQFR